MVLYETTERDVVYDYDSMFIQWRIAVAKFVLFEICLLIQDICSDGSHACSREQRRTRYHRVTTHKG